MSESGAGEPEVLEVPAGAPVRVPEWLLVPVVLTLLAVAVIWFSQRTTIPIYLDVTASIVIAAAAVQGFFGWRAWSTLTAEAVQRFRWSVTGTLAAVGLASVFGTQPVAVIAFALVGFRVARDGGRWVKRVRAARSGRWWIRATVVAAIVAVVIAISRPVAWGLGIAASMVAAILCVAVALTVGFAYRMRPDDHRFF